ncbi:acyl-CoA synthetase [Phenylobacterium sp. Root77]|uniref:acyl-CoA synthetase n=1 Tax=unclassified Phenylobacterium TaxID=2640670 RepID=UPI0006F79041|nr:MULTISPECIES: acyl-CoA synthetase [unclassified Phenylobacterium]KQW72910.1 acyl-CoA synthetase [Phenylobacterium sp. Root1277]KQW92128.1 acyl-CoA synthetase [Phenylobacterium sp. Root1290]KRC40359.1 acyl-CoA synthetase [Phenylobacterium sp. Root77]
MHPANHAQTNPDRAAYIMAGSGETVSYRELDERSNQGAQLFRSMGLKTGDVIAILMENHPRFFEIAWAAQRAGLYYACVSSKLTAGEVEYIMKDCEAKVLITSTAVGPVVDELPPLLPGVKLFMVGQPRAPYESFEAARDVQPSTPIADESGGADMLYSSGTTGRPKGIKPPLTGAPIDAPNPLAMMAQMLFGFQNDSIYLSPAPLYHAAPLRWCMSVHRLGGTVVVMEKFDPEDALALIEEHKIDVGQFVPTHFVRMLKLPPEVRAKYDVSSMRSAVHAAAPCPIPVKEQMMAWWGPVIHEYYAGSEGNGFCYIGPHDWLTHKGSVGKATTAELHIVGEDGEELPPRSEGVVYFGGGAPLTYHNAPDKIAENTNKYGWTTLGDVGWVDEEGFLYLTDRKSFMIISGGVNIYPQELENLLITHPKVADAAVVGAPDEEMGEKVVAVIQPMDWSAAGEDLKAELAAFCRANLSHVKSPRLIEFMQELPRHPTGKLYKRLIRDAYWGKEGSRIV